MASTYAILKKQEVLKDKIDRDNLLCYLSGIYPISISKELEDLIRTYVLPENFYGREKVVINLVNAIEGSELLEDRINVNIMQRDIGLLIGNEQAEQFIKLLTMYSRQYTGNYTAALYDKLIVSNTVSTKELLIITLLFITFMYSLEELDTWHKRSAYKVASAYRNAISYEHGVSDLKLKPEDISTAGILEDIPLEEKKNIIGSLWNCIIDIIVDKNINGERSEQ